MATIAREQTRGIPGKRKPGRPTLSDEQLLDAALDLFLAGGFEQTSIDAIASAVGMAKRTVYARYPDKTELFKAALKRAVEGWIVPIERLQAAECDDLEATLLRIARILLINILNPAGLRLLRLSNAASYTMPEIAARNTRMGTEPTLSYLADLFRRTLLPASAPAAEADEAAFAFLHLIVGDLASNASWGVVYDEAALDQHIAYCVRLFLHGTLPSKALGVIESDIRRMRIVAEEALVVLAQAKTKLSQA